MTPELRNQSVLEAAGCGYTPRLRWLISGADREYVDVCGLTALHRAAVCGFEDTVELLIQGGWRVDETSPFGTPLCLAAFYGQAKIVAQLLRYRANVNAECEKLGSPLHAASLAGEVHIVQSLLQCGAHVNASVLVLDELQPNPLMAIFDAAADRTLLVYISPMTAAVTYGHLDVVETLYQYGGDPNSNSGKAKQPTFGFQTPLMQATCKTQLSAMKLLIARGADVNAQGGLGGDCPVLVAGRGNNLAALQLLKSHGADLSVRDNQGYTALILGAKNGHSESVKWLLQNRVDVTAKNGNGHTALHLAASRNHPRCIVALLSRGAELECRDNKDRTALAVAAFGIDSKRDAIVQLVKTGAKVQVVDCNGDTVLHRAVALDPELGQGVQSMWILINAGAKINAVNNAGLTALHVAAQNGQEDQVQLLLQAGADSSMRCPHGERALDKASRGGKAGVVALLSASRGGDKRSWLSKARRS